MEAKKEEAWTIGLRSPSLSVSVLILALAALILAVLTFGPQPSIAAAPSVPDGSLVSAFLLFFMPLIVGNALSAPIAGFMGGKLTSKRAFTVGLLSLLPIGVTMIVWRIYHLVTGGGAVEGAFLAAFGIVLWENQLIIAGISGPTPIRIWPASLAAPVTGILLTWVFLGAGTWPVLEGTLFILIAMATGYFMLYGTDVPLKREFGEGAVSIVRPLFDHMNESDPEGQRRMELFFDRTAVTSHLSASLIGFRTQGKSEVDWVVPSVHPGPFAELGASDLPNKLSSMLSDASEEIVVPHAPCTHDQNVPTTGEVARVASHLKNAIKGFDWKGRVRVSRLVSPHEGSIVRAQVLGDAVIMVVTMAPAASDDVDYAVGEMLRDEARRLGFKNPVVIDAHNSFIGEEQSEGNISFGSPASFKVRTDAVAAIRAAMDGASEGPIRVGFARRKGYTTHGDGIGKEGLSVTVIDAGGEITAYALFDGNNLLQGLRERLQDVGKGLVGYIEVMTTDNHAVHAVQGGINPVGKLRGINELSADLKDTLSKAISKMAPAEVASASIMMEGVKVMGPGATNRLTTALSDSFHVFWTLMSATLVITIVTELLLLALLP